MPLPQSAPTPSAAFERFAADTIARELAKSQSAPREAVIRRLWATAQYDFYSQHGTLRPMLDEASHPLHDVVAYAAIIDREVARLEQQKPNLRLIRRQPG